MPNVVVLATGGTIASRRGPSGAVIATDDPSALTRDTRSDVSVEAHEVVRTGSYRLDFADFRAIADAVHKHLARPDVDGIVITHGTDTLEETAVLLDLVHSDARPVVLTGAQRAADVADTDGPRNLSDAIAVAADPSAAHHGVLIAFAGTVLAARGTRKSHTTASAGFTNPAGTVGTVVDGHVDIHATTIRPKALEPVTEDFDSTRVDIVSVYPGGDDVLLRAAVRAGARGVIVVGTGIGNAPPGIAEAIRELSDDGVVFGLATRVAAGPVQAVYGDGGGTDLVAAGAVPLQLPPSQSRMLLALLLSAGHSPHDIRGLLIHHT